MRVLKSGTGAKGWSAEKTCTGSGNGGGGCGAVLLVEQDDVFETTSSACGEIERHATFRCAECGVWTDVPRPPFRLRRQDVGRDGDFSGDTIGRAG